MLWFFLAALIVLIPLFVLVTDGRYFGKPLIRWIHHRVVPEWLGPVRALVKPVSEGFFAGVLDLRDWDAIRAWANTLPAKLLP